MSSKQSTKGEADFRRGIVRARWSFGTLLFGSLLLIFLLSSIVYLRFNQTLKLGIERNARIYANTLLTLEKWHSSNLVDDYSRLENDPMLRDRIAKKMHGIVRESTVKARASSDFNTRMISLSPINTANKPDNLESNALLSIAEDGQPVELFTKDLSFRGVYPVATDHGCKACHISAIETENRPFGAISVSLDAASIRKIQDDNIRLIAALACLSGALIIGMIYIFGWRQVRQRLLDRYYQQHRDQTDPLTGLSNRWKMYSVLESEIKRARRFTHPLSVALIDIDYLKQINDRWGRRAGDSVLKHVSGILARDVRAYDIVGSSTGKEFMLILPQTELKETQEVCERLREKIALSPAPYYQKRIAVTVSIGVVKLMRGDRTADELVVRAGGALYNAKANGHNQVEVDDVTEATNS